MPSIFSQEDKDAIRSRLLTEGKEMMLQSGITKMNLEKLALSAGIAKGTFYHFFRTKQHFILAIIRSYQQQRYEVLMKVAAEKKGSLTVREAVEMFLSVYDPAENPMFHMRDRDLDWIAEKIPPSELFDPVMDLKCCNAILSCVKNRRGEADPRIVSNFSRMVMFTLMQRDNVHQEVLNENIRMVVNLMADYITGNSREENLNHEI